MESINIKSLFAHAKNALFAKEPAVALFTMLLLVGPAHAQFERANAVINWAQVVLAGVAVAVVTIAIMWAGFKIMWGHETLAQQAKVLIGSALVGGAAAVAAVLVG
ncbi:TrbC/VirB2 family protein [Burkholderia ubonensis]|uniref:TrbC/VirB2 family protein n=1 Tax=Burkholderia ubonensis TaxID=101571 RepID=UPI002AB1740D|nr:TrbC/VirB2 family protein [Burkholderia ubonensis]